MPAGALRLQAAIAGLAGAAASLALLPFPASAFAAGLALLACLIAAVDLERYIIPDTANAVMFAGGLLLCLLEAQEGVGAALVDALLRALVAGGFLYLVRFVYHRARGELGLGLGDVKLAAAAGPWLAWEMLPIALELTAVAALLAAGLSSLRTGEALHGRLALPLGTFLAPAVWASFMAERMFWTS